MKVATTYTIVQILLHIIFSVSSFAQTVLPSQVPTEEDDYSILLEGNDPVSNLSLIDEMKSMGRSEILPWSNSYWPIHKGMLAHRYSMSGVPTSKTWTDYYHQYQSFPSNQAVLSQRIDELSPAEKYDLLIGDSSWKLTHYMWHRGQDSMKRYGTVATWTGICHGWAAASQVGVPPAQHAVDVMDITGQYKIRFYPFDINALSSFLWARTPEKTFFAGTRCKVETPDEADGRILDPRCFDNNPMTWHLALVNRMGFLGKSLIMDSSVNTEVWNYVIDSYQFSYFNPRSLEFSAQLQDALVKRSNFFNDPYSEFRSKDSVYLVGVMMDVFYPGAIAPHEGVPSLQYLQRHRYFYDLELDKNLNIIGGEWHQTEHPDFLWGYPDVTNPFAHTSDYGAIDPDPSLPLVNTETTEEARRLSERGRVLSDIIYKLVARSQERQ